MKNPALGTVGGSQPVPLWAGTHLSHASRYELGPALYLGWSASLLSILGGICVFSTCCCASKEDPDTR